MIAESGRRSARARLPASFDPVLIGAVVGLVVLLGGLFAPLTASGPGSVRPVHETADLLLRGTVEPWAPRWVGLVLYLPAVFAALVLVLLGVGGRARRSAVIPAVTNLVLILVAGFAVGRGMPLHGGAGHRRLLLGAIVLVFTTVPAAVSPDVRPVGR